MSKTPAQIVKKGRVLVVGDVHVPFHDKKAWNLVLSVIAATQPEAVLQVGDMGDLLAVNSHGKNFGDRYDLDKELKAVRYEWDQLEAATGDNMLVFLEGNHDRRLAKYVANNAPMIEGLVPNLKVLYGMSEETICRPYQQPFKIGRVRYVHDQGFSGRTATQQTLDAVGHSIVHGHVHRGTIVYSGTTEDDRWFGLGAGWLGDKSKITYAPPSRTREWQLGFGIVDYRDNHAFAQFIPIVNGRCFLDGKIYR